MPSTNRSGGHFSGSNPRVWEGVNVSNLNDIKAMLDEIEERGRKWLAEVLTTPVDKLSPAVSPNTEEVSPVVKSAATGKEVEEVSYVAPGEEISGKGHTMDSCHCQTRMV